MTFLLAAIALAGPTVSVRVEGSGYLRFALDGRVVYAKAAKLTVTRGHLADVGGAEVLPTFGVPDAASDLKIGGDGHVWATTGGGTTAIGTLILAKFDHEGALSPNGAYLVSKSRPILGHPGANGFGMLVTESPWDTQAAALSPSVKQSGSQAEANVDLLRITLKERIETDAARAVLGEIAQIQGKDDKHAGEIDFGPLPPVGSALRLTRERIVTRLLASGLKAVDYDLSAPTVCEVARRGQKVSHTQFIEAATAYAGSSLGSPGTWTSGDALPDIPVPNGVVSLKAESIRTVEGGANVVVAVYVDGRRLNSRTVHVTSSAPPVEGVKAGATIKVRFLISGIVAEVDGRAKTSGFVGQSVEVLVSMAPGEPPTTHTGTVVAPGRVEVKL